MCHHHPLTASSAGERLIPCSCLCLLYLVCVCVCVCVCVPRTHIYAAGSLVSVSSRYSITKPHIESEYKQHKKLTQRLYVCTRAGQYINIIMLSCNETSGLLRYSIKCCFSLILKLKWCNLMNVPDCSTCSNTCLGPLIIMTTLLMIADQISDYVNIIKAIPTILSQYRYWGVWAKIVLMKCFWGDLEYQNISESELLHFPANRDISLPQQPKDSNINNNSKKINNIIKR